MRTITVRELCSAVGGELLAGSPDAAVGAVGTDSRTVAAGECFIALVGETFDGHDYIDAALARGAAGCLCSRAPETLRDGAFCVRVPDTLRAYGALAAWHRAAFDIPVVQVTGSVGKTTAKEMLAAVLAQRFHTLKTEANYNNEVGTPRTLLRLDGTHGAAVVETGMDRAGQIRRLGAMVKPTVAVITNIGDAHIEYLGSREGILAAKCEIFENLAPDGLAVLNGDDELLNTVCLPQRIVTVGTGGRCAVRVSDIADRGLDGVDCAVTTARARYALSIPAPGAHMIYPAAIAVAVGEELGLSAEEIVRGVAAYEPAGSRMRVLRLSGGRRLLDDCYNASPQSMRASLAVLAKSEGKRIAVLGDMNELGAESESAHRSIGALTRELGVDAVIAIGVKAKDLADCAGENARWFATVDEALETIRAAFAENTAMLVKASHAMRFDTIVEELTKET